MEFVKMHGLGNDFVFLDHFFVSPEVDYPELARKLCHRQFGVGGDGLAVILPSEVADVRMRIFNPDGSEPEMCGNAIRCLARYVYDQKYVTHNPVQVETLAGILSLQLTLVEGEVIGVRVDMGEPILKPELVPVRSSDEEAIAVIAVIADTLVVDGAKFQFTAVSMGNPHCVIFVEDLAKLDFYHFGPLIEQHELFPRKTNVEFIQIDSAQEMTMKVWERGAGPTLACGTGACAAVVAGVLNDKNGRRVTVHLPGGDLDIQWGEDNHVYMTGPASYSFRGKLIRDSIFEGQKTIDEG
ncbi:MAG: diaminopimelate epimerase [Desulfitobacteriaceae bacterium]